MHLSREHLIAAVGGILLLCGVFAVFAFNDSTNNQASVTLEAKSDAPPLGPHRNAPEGYTEYYDSIYRFSLFYPSDLSVESYDEGAGAATITFQNPETAHGFQIFILPYAEDQVSEERFRLDEPSGVRTGEQRVSIDGALAASFFSESLTLGETAEVWFVHGGYLYEVTTLKPLSGWLSGIMRTWKFL